MAATANDFRSELAAEFSKAKREGLAVIEVRSGDLHRSVGGYPGANHSMPVCCDVMRSAMRDGDIVVAEPPKGRGANLVVRYKL